MLNRRTAILCVLCVLCGSNVVAGTCVSSVRGVNRQQVIVAAQSAVVVPNGFIVVPFAVPVAVPSYVQYQAAVMPTGIGNRDARIGEEKLEVAVLSDPRHPTPDSRSLTAVHCATCHSGPTPKGKLDLSGELTADVRLKSIARILSDNPTRRMPKGKQLDAQAIGLLIQELSRSP